MISKLKIELSYSLHIKCILYFNLVLMNCYFTKGQSVYVVFFLIFDLLI